MYMILFVKKEAFDAVIIYFLLYIPSLYLLIQNIFPRGDAGGLGREYVLRIPSVS